MEVEDKQNNDPMLLELTGAIHTQRVQVFSQGGYGVLCYQGRLCIPNVSELRHHILAEDHNSNYSIYLSDTNMN